MPFLKKLSRGDTYVIDLNWGNNASLLTNGHVAIPIRDYLEIVEAAETHTVLGTDGGAVTAIVEKLTGTQAPNAGQNCFKTSTFNLKATINTPQRLVASQLTALTAAQRAGQLFSPGDRIAFSFTGTLTALAGVGVTIILRPTRPKAVQGR